MAELSDYAQEKQSKWYDKTIHFELPKNALPYYWGVDTKDGFIRCFRTMNSAKKFAMSIGGDQYFAGQFISQDLEIVAQTKTVLFMEV